MNRTQLLVEALTAYEKYGSYSAAAKAVKMPTNTLRDRVMEAKRHGITVVQDSEENAVKVDQVSVLQDQLRTLKAQLQSAKANTLTDEYVKSTIIKLAEADVEPPTWLLKTPKTSHVTGVPTLFASDWHWGEVVDPKQINGVNEYNIAIAQKRARNMIETTVDLLKNRFSNPTYPGIVFALGGDMVSGDIHEELSITNETDIMPVVIDLWGVLSWCIKTLADEFGQVFLPCVGGNHARTTHKIRAKGRNFTSFDWLLYNFLAKLFENDPRVRFLIPDGPDAYYKIYNTSYLLTHGDQFRGGDGMIGPLGPILRGDHKKRSRYSQVGQDYDVMLLGHWHQLIMLSRLIVNGNLKGYDEYSFSNNFSYEPPKQALWLTHPNHGITFSAPVLVERSEAKKVESWVSVLK